jgi:hypothetical protein
MRSKIKLTEAEKREFEQYREAGLSPRQIRNIKRDAAKMRDYIEFLTSL